MQPDWPYWPALLQSLSAKPPAHYLNTQPGWSYRSPLALISLILDLYMQPIYPSVVSLVVLPLDPSMLPHDSYPLKLLSFFPTASTTLILPSSYHSRSLIRPADWPNTSPTVTHYSSFHLVSVYIALVLIFCQTGVNIQLINTSATIPYHYCLWSQYNSSLCPLISSDVCCPRSTTLPSPVLACTR